VRILEVVAGAHCFAATAGDLFGRQLGNYQERGRPGGPENGAKIRDYNRLSRIAGYVPVLRGPGELSR